jgi:hypothetical protein
MAEKLRCLLGRCRDTPVEFDISADLAARLIAEQFPQWAGLPVRPVGSQGRVNYRLGDDLVIRLPRVPDTGGLGRILEEGVLPRLRHSCRSKSGSQARPAARMESSAHRYSHGSGLSRYGRARGSHRVASPLRLPLTRRTEASQGRRVDCRPRYLQHDQQVRRRDQRHLRPRHPRRGHQPSHPSRHSAVRERRARCTAPLRARHYSAPRRRRRYPFRPRSIGTASSWNGRAVARQFPMATRLGRCRAFRTHDARRGIGWGS